jgi:phosphoribosylformylglycinamidine synthase
VVESVVNIACSGARAVALVNCLNFGNPEHPEVMWELSESIDGMAEACRALDLPVVGGNVSLYNESSGADISPTPVVAALGVIDNLVTRPPGMALREGGSIVLLGHRSSALAGSRLATERLGAHGGSLADVDYGSVRALVGALVQLVTDGLVSGVHDVSDGGLAVCLAEMAVRSGIGLQVGGIGDRAELFSETPGRVVACTMSVDRVLEVAQAARVPATVIGKAQGDRIVIDGHLDLRLADVTDTWAGALPRALGETVQAMG